MPTDSNDATLAPTGDDHRLAARLAHLAGELLLDIRASEPDAETRKARGDRESNELLLSALHAERPDDAILSEESADDLSRIERRRVWIIDPLDGTREFGEPGRDDWAVHVALSIDGAALCGAVSLPSLGLVLHTGEPQPVADVARPPRLVLSRTRVPKLCTDVAALLGADLVEMGSAGAKAMAVLRGEADVYLHEGGQYQWDNCAPVAVALAAGLHCSRIDGSPFVYNHASPEVPDLLICHPSLAQATLAAIVDAQRG